MTWEQSFKSLPRSTFLNCLIAVFCALVMCIGTNAEEKESDELTQLRENLIESEAWNSLNVGIVEIQASPVNDFYTAILSNNEITYIHKSGKFLFSDVLLLLDGDEAIRYTEQVKRAQRKKVFTSEKLASIDFVPPEGTQHVAYVFTDITCGYCRQLHNEMDGYHEEGIEIRYLLWARAGHDSNPHREMESAWCSKNPQAALTRLKQGKRIRAASCTNNLGDIYTIASKLQISGTPAIILENGTLIPGYVEPARLSEVIRVYGN